MNLGSLARDLRVFTQNAACQDIRARLESPVHAQILVGRLTARAVGSVEGTWGAATVVMVLICPRPVSHLLAVRTHRALMRRLVELTWLQTRLRRLHRLMSLNRCVDALRDIVLD